MATEDRNGCLHGEDDGKFVAKTDTDKKAYDSKDNFGELKKKLNRTGILKKKKSIRSLNKVIEKHKQKIDNPEIFYPDWKSYSEVDKKRVKKHWEKEINTYRRQIFEIEKQIGEQHGRERNFENGN